MLKEHKEEDADDALIKKYITTGNSGYFEPIVERYERYAYIYAYSLLKNEFDAQDVVAESFLKAFAKIRQYRLDSSFKNWFLKIVHNNSLDLLRKNKTMVYLDDQENGERFFTDEALSYDNIESLDFGELQKSLDQLPHELKGAVILRYYYDWDYKKICEFLNIPMGTLSSRLNRACKKLKNLYEGGM
ncbi:sigma-70 family RNA polymerase sigma factor [Acetobacterium malicum]|uniref:Sigma-70 family RNA polymerase sigma factor n=1 Tax=Acetobacterium malicum TaxID=52692 RepID=A0ABR6YYN6_9FIRM|nr:sigma-70 family RNA polymerase sigma factor [Acetobacterium malicum]